MDESFNIFWAAGMSGEWHYSQGEHSSTGGNTGDCTDYVHNAVSEVMGEEWAAASGKANTVAFLKGEATGYTEVELGMVRGGDLVVQGSHAGIVFLTATDGSIIGLANNGRPASSEAGYKDGRTGLTVFSENAFGPGPVRVFRPIRN